MRLGSIRGQCVAGLAGVGEPVGDHPLDAALAVAGGAVAAESLHRPALPEPFGHGASPAGERVALALLEPAGAPRAPGIHGSAAAGVSGCCRGGHRVLAGAPGGAAGSAQADPLPGGLGVGRPPADTEPELVESRSGGAAAGGIGGSGAGPAAVAGGRHCPGHVVG